MWVRSNVMVPVMFGIPVIMIGVLVNTWFLLLFGLIFVPGLLLRPAVE